MHKFKVLKLPNVSESTISIFYKRKRYTKVLSINFFQKWGWARRAHASAKRLPPFFGKNFIEKNFCVPFAFVKNGTGAF